MSEYELGRIAAVIPAFDAGQWVGDVVRRTLRELEPVIVVDDGSSDDTAAVAEAAGALLLRHEINRGKGAALWTAFHRLFDEEGFDAVLTLDADGQHLPEEIPRLVAAAPGADLVLGSRDHLFQEMSTVRRWSNTLSSRAISFAAGRPLADVQTGFRVYARRLWDRIGFPEGRFEAESAVVVRAARSGLTVRAVPISLGFVDGRHTSHYRPLVDSLRIARAVTMARFGGSGASWNSAALS